MTIHSAMSDWNINQLNQWNQALTNSASVLASGVKTSVLGEQPAADAVATRLQTESLSDSVAQSNIESAVSLLGTADTALSTINSELTDMRSLFVQADNGTYNPSDLASMQNQINQTTANINETINQTNFNGNALFVANSGSTNVVSDSNPSALQLVSAVNTGTWSNSVSVSALAQAMQVSGSAQTGSTSALGLSGSFSINGTTINVTTSDSLTDIANTINQSNAGVTASINASNELVLTSQQTGTNGAIVAAEGSGGTGSGSFSSSNTTVATTNTLVSNTSFSDTLDVAQIAEAMQVSGATQTSATTALGLSGTFVLDNTAFSVSSNDTLANIESAINGAGINVTASIGSNNQLILTSNTTGSSSSITASDSTSNVNTTTSSNPNAVTIASVTQNTDWTHTIDVTQMAQAMEVEGASQTSTSAALGLNGTFTVNGHSFSVTSSDSLANIESAINSANVGVTASLNTNNALVLTANQTGTASAFSAQDTTTNGNTYASSNQAVATTGTLDSNTNWSQTLTVNQIATAMEVGSNTLSSATSALGYTGQFVLDGTSFSVSNTESLQNIANAINSAGIDVTASINTSNELILTSNTTGTGGAITASDQTSNGNTFSSSNTAVATTDTLDSNTAWSQNLSVSALAQAEVATGTTSASSATTALGYSGSFTLDGTSFTVTTSDTLDNIVSLINNAGINVTASVNASNQLVLTSKQTGTAGTITASDASSGSSSWSQSTSVVPNNDLVSSTVTIGGNLYIGDQPNNTTTGGGVYEDVGGNWTALGGDYLDGSTGSNDGSNTVNTLADVNGTIYAGTNNGVYAWNGSSWSSIGYTSFGGSADITSLYYDSTTGDLYAGVNGSASGSGDTVYQYNFSSQIWSQLGQSVSPGGTNISDMTYFNGQAGTSGLVVSLTGGGVMTWNGSNWAQVGPSSDLDNASTSDDSASVNSLSVVNNVLYAGTMGAGVYAWNGSSWSQVGNMSLDGAGGFTPSSGGDGSSQLEYAQSLSNVNNTLYADTQFGVYDWNGSTWSVVGSNPIDASGDQSHGILTDNNGTLTTLGLSNANSEEYFYTLDSSGPGVLQELGVLNSSGAVNVTTSAQNASYTVNGGSAISSDSNTITLTNGSTNLASVTLSGTGTTTVSNTQTNAVLTDIGVLTSSGSFNNVIQNAQNASYTANGTNYTSAGNTVTLTSNGTNLGSVDLLSSGTTTVSNSSTNAVLETIGILNASGGFATTVQEAEDLLYTEDGTNESSQTNNNVSLPTGDAIINAVSTGSSTISHTVSSAVLQDLGVLNSTGGFANTDQTGQNALYTVNGGSTLSASSNTGIALYNGSTEDATVNLVGSGTTTISNTPSTSTVLQSLGITNSSGSFSNVSQNAQNAAYTVNGTAETSQSNQDVQINGDEIVNLLGIGTAVLSSTPSNGNGSSTSFLFQTGADEGDTLSVVMQALNQNTLGIDSLSVYDPQAAISAIDAAMQQIAQNQTQIGAYRNVLQYESSNLQRLQINQEKAYAKIADTNITKAMSAEIKEQILFQSAISVQKMINLNRNNILKLLNSLA